MLIFSQGLVSLVRVNLLLSQLGKKRFVKLFNNSVLVSIAIFNSVC